MTIANAPLTNESIFFAVINPHWVFDNTETWIEQA